MTGLAVTFADPERLQIDYFDAVLENRPESYAPATVDPRFPASPLTGDATHLQVELELGGAGDYPVTERAQVRFTVYAAPGQRDNVKDAAGLVLALFASQPGGADVAGVTILIGRSDVVTDPATRNLMVWFLGRVDLKAHPLAS